MSTPTNSLRRDAAFAIRYHWRHPTLAVMVIVTIAIAIAAVTATFGLVNAVLLRPLPIREQGHVVIVQALDLSQHEPHVGIPSGSVRDLEEATQAFTGAAAVMMGGPQPFVVQIGARHVAFAESLVAGKLFDVLGVVAAAGRVLDARDDVPGSAPAALLSYDAWMRDFGGDRRVIGQTIRLRNTTYTIVGVTPKDFDYPRGTELWTSLAALSPTALELTNSGAPSDIVARLAPRQTVSMARARVVDYLQHSSSTRLGDPRSRAAIVEPFARHVVGDLRPALLILSAAVLLVLVLACANVAGLLFTRGIARTQEFALRVALGASYGRLVGQLVVESALLAAAAGVLGVALSAVALKVVLVFAPGNLPRLNEAHLGGPALLVTLILLLGALVLFGIAPSVVTARRSLNASLRDGGQRVAGGGAVAIHARELTVAIQVMLGIVVLTSAVLLGRSLAHLERLDLGFDADRLLFVGVQGTRRESNIAAASAHHLRMLTQLAARLSHAPGIIGATTTLTPPVVGVTAMSSYIVEGQTADNASRNTGVRMDIASDNYFRVFGIALVQGRPFTSADAAGAEPTVIVSQAFARLAWPHRGALGQRLRLTSGAPDPWRTVVGVVADTRYGDVRSIGPAVYVPLHQTNALVAFVTIRTTGDPLLALPLVRRALADVDPTYAIREFDSGRDLVRAQGTNARLLTASMAALSVLAVGLVTLGLFGALAAYVRARSHEFGVRLALGAPPRALRWMVFRHATRMILGGMMFGLPVALVAARALRTMLFQVSPTDLLSFVGVVTFVVASALVAGYMPARRASNVAPSDALRSA